MIIYWRCSWLKSLLNVRVFCRLGGGGIIVGLKVWVKYVTLKAYLVHQVLQWQRTMIESLLVWSHLACPVQPLNNKHGKKKKAQEFWQNWTPYLHRVIRVQCSYVHSYYCTKCSWELLYLLYNLMCKLVRIWIFNNSWIHVIPKT